MHPADVLRPNYMGSTLDNRGVESLTQNTGYGVREAGEGTMQAVPQQADETSAMNKLRVAKAREFGKPKEEIGF